MCDKFSKGLKKREAQLGIYYNLFPELLTGEYKQANNLWDKVIRIGKEIRYINRQGAKRRLRSIARTHTTSKNDGTTSNSKITHSTTDEEPDRREVAKGRVSDRKRHAWNSEVAKYIRQLANKLLEV